MITRLIMESGMTKTARGKGRPRLIESGEIDRAIREAALRILLEHGEAATMNAVAVQAGISRKSLYARYPNKSALFLTVIGDLLQGAGGLDYDSSGNAERRLLHYFEAAFAALDRPQSKAIQRLLHMDSAYIGALRSQMLDAAWRIFFEPLKALLEHAQRHGEFSIDEIDATARVIMRLIFTASLAPHSEAHPSLTSDEPHEYAAFLARLITRGLLPRNDAVRWTND
jgi:TetR/AcrR family transcriptional regulator, mexJK operon transcriptional repressor